MGHKFDPSRKELLDSPDRREWQNPQAILEAFEVMKGMVVADVGCGTGFFSIPAAGMVGTRGRVYAVDVQEEMLWSLQERLLKEGVGNVLPVLSLEDVIPLPSGSVDMVLLVNTLHELAGDATILEISRILRTEGHAAVVDWKKEPMEMGPPLEHRLSLSDANDRLTARGFKVKEVQVGPLHYGIKAARTGDLGH
ncbi:MAG: class I SAM-dependent methyltransferase, partial [Thermoplasmata archaeon]